MRYLQIILSLLLVAAPSPAFAANTLPANGEAEAANAVIWLLFGLAVVIVIIGLYLSSQKKVVIFANYTDVMFTLLALFIPPVVHIAYGVITNTKSGQEIPVHFMVGAFAILFLFVAKATFSYNQGLFSFLVALFSKFFLMLCFLLALVVAIAIAFGNKDRRKDELQKAFEARRRKEKAQGAVVAAAATGLFAVILFKLGLREEGFVSLSDYFKGHGLLPHEAQQGQGAGQ